MREMYYIKKLIIKIILDIIVIPIAIMMLIFGWASVGYWFFNMSLKTFLIAIVGFTFIPSSFIIWASINKEIIPNEDISVNKKLKSIIKSIENAIFLSTISAFFYMMFKFIDKY